MVENNSRDSQRETFRFREFRGVIGIVVKVLALSLPLCSVIWVSGIIHILRISVFQQQFLGIGLSILLSLTFLLLPARKGLLRHKLPWYDFVLAFLGLAAGAYLALFYPQIVIAPFRSSPADMTLGIITILLLLEATRRLQGWPLVIIALVFIFYAYYCNFLPGLLHGKGYSWSRIIPFLYFQTSGIPGVVLNIALTIVLAYVLFGNCLARIGAIDFLTNFSLLLVGTVRGGPAKVSVISSGLFGTISGSAVANVTVDGWFTINMMKKLGYKSHFAAAVECVASTGGVIMPPVMGAVAFVMAEFLGVHYSVVAISAILPAVLYYVALFIQVDLEAGKTGLRGLPRKEIPPLKGSFIVSGLKFLVPVVVLIYFLLIRRISAELAALYSIASAIIISWFTKGVRMGPRKIIATLEETGYGILDIGVICALIGIIIGIFNLTGLALNFSRMLTALAGGRVFPLLVLTAITSIILGMGVTITACYILLAVIVPPALIEKGIDPIAAHMFILYFGAMSFITPPVAPATVAAAAIARSPFWLTGWTGMRLAIVAFVVPFIFVYHPALLMIGQLKIVEIIFNFMTACLGAVFLGIGVEGYLLRNINWISRVLFLVGGVGLIIPEWETSLLALAPLLYEWRSMLTLFRRLMARLHCLKGKAVPKI